MKMSYLISIFAIFLPWPAKRYVYRRILKYTIEDGARIGASLILAKRVVLKRNARIGSLNVVKGLENLILDEFSIIGNLNWITGFPKGGGNKNFLHVIDRMPQLIVGEHAAITNRHLIDCTSTVSIGRFSTFAGFRSQILTHSIDLVKNRQDSKPVSIGEYTFIGTGCIILPGSMLPDYSILAAGSTVNKALNDRYVLYAGSPAVPKKKLENNLAYFNRKCGCVD